VVEEALPTFRYHPDPIGTGSVTASSAPCLACGQRRDYLYVGPVYAVDDLVNSFCPWCIADGSAAARFDAEFTDVGWGVPDVVPAAAVEEIARRTPSFESWQQDHWLYHCSDGCAFLGRVGREQLDAYPEALEMLLHEHAEQGWDVRESESYVDSLDADGDAVAYLFRCLTCGTHLAFSDCS
jgi:hypothetical protein